MAKKQKSEKMPGLYYASTVFTVVFSIFVILLVVVYMAGVEFGSESSADNTDGSLKFVIIAKYDDANITILVDNDTVVEEDVPLGSITIRQIDGVSRGLHTVVAFYHGELQEQWNVDVDTDKVSKVDIVIYSMEGDMGG